MPGQARYLVLWPAHPAFAEKFLNFIISEVIRHHEQIAEEAVTRAGVEGE